MLSARHVGSIWISTSLTRILHGPAPALYASLSPCKAQARLHKQKTARLHKRKPARAAVQLMSDRSGMPSAAVRRCCDPPSGRPPHAPAGFLGMRDETRMNVRKQICVPSLVSQQQCNYLTRRTRIAKPIAKLMSLASVCPACATRWLHKLK